MKPFLPTPQYATHVAHSILQPMQNLWRKARLRDFDLAPGATLPVVRLDPWQGCGCETPGCHHLIDDALRFHQRNAPQAGARRWITPSAMLLDLGRFQSGDAYVRAVSKRSNGNIARSAKKATRLGVLCRPIHPGGYEASIAAIKASKRVRSGGPVLAAWFSKSGALPDSCVPVEPPACPKHWTLSWGAFLDEGQGPRLIAWLSLRRVGDMCRIHELMAHGDYLHMDAMKLLFLEVVRELIDGTTRDARGLRWLMYGALEHGGPGLHQWKRLFLLQPMTFTMHPQPAPEMTA
jgi:hypothetical protein